MLAQLRRETGVRDAMLARLDLAELQRETVV
jgi:hypothetical protein